MEAVAGVLHLHLREVFVGRAVEVHPPSREQGEVHRVRRADQVEPLPVGIVLALAADRGEEPFGVVSAPMTRATSQKPARIWARALCSACDPLAHAA